MTRRQKLRNMWNILFLLAGLLFLALSVMDRDWLWTVTLACAGVGWVAVIFIEWKQPHPKDIKESK